MNSVIISIGNELLSGNVANTNAIFISNFLKKYGISVKQILIVPDEEESILDALSKAENYGSVIFVTGGLGPTHDDITKKSAAKYFKSDIKFHPDVLVRIKQFFIDRKIKFSNTNNEQALLPEKCNIIPNANGTAQGMCFKKENKSFYFMPGVPFEMKKMMHDSISKDLDNFGKSKIQEKLIRTFGLPESEVYSQIKAWIKKNNDIGVSLLPTLDGVDIQLYTDQSQDQKDLKTLCMELEGILGEKIYGFNNENLETVIANTLIDSKLTISVAESCTGGLISNRLTDIPGSSGYFLSGIVTYSNKSKINFLDVNPKTIQSFGAVSHETAKEMAVGIRKKK